MGAAPSKKKLIARRAKTTAVEVKEEEIKKKMKVFVVIPRPDRAAVVLDVCGEDTVRSVKAQLHGMEGIPPRRQRLVFACSALPDDDDTTLAEHGVTRRRSSSW
jgi:hypothetical protein